MGASSVNFTNQLTNLELPSHFCHTFQAYCVRFF
ncbi:Uncharacterised protein [Vibrio cholerae]|nr:Uncharacterised protein [Vibrio cholerae]CSB75819.1 Uncharacterised protein [Vibrio cholerae]